MSRYHYAPVTSATAREAAELDYADTVALCESTDYSDAGDLQELADAHDELQLARSGWITPGPVPAVPVARDTMELYVTDRAPWMAPARHRAAGPAVTSADRYATLLATHRAAVPVDSRPAVPFNYFRAGVTA